MSTQLTPFEFQGHEVRILPHEDGVSFWAVAKDVTDILGYAEAKDGLRRVPEKHKGRRSVPTPGGNQEMLCVDEAGLYRLILRSDKPEAEPFMEWVTSEVLPAIRLTGRYEPPKAKPPAAFQKKIKEQEEDILFLAEENARLEAENIRLIHQVMALQTFKIAHLEAPDGTAAATVEKSAMTPAQKKQALLLARHGQSAYIIAEKLGCDIDAVKQHLRSKGIKQWGDL
jgi:prophage antirepressor-like protein